MCRLLSTIKTYQSFGTYKTMDSHYKTAFDTLVDYYGNILNSNQTKDSTYFTLHDFDHHCIDIYKNIDSYLLNGTLNALNQLELYLLNLAVLFHDISMSQGGYDNINKKRTKFCRTCHSSQTAEWLGYEYSNTSSTLFEKGVLTENALGELQKICKAHSDIKSSGITKEQCGLFASDLDFEFTGEREKIATKALAAILRLADEFDITNLRIGNTRDYEKLGNSTEDIESRRHWDCLKLVKQLKVSASAPTIVKIVLCDRIIEDRINGGDAENVKDAILQIKCKLQNEIDYARQEVFDKDSFSFRLCMLREVVLETQSDEVKNLLENTASDGAILPSHTPLETPENKNSPNSPPNNSNEIVKDKFCVEVISSRDLNNKLQNFIEEKSLLSIGHYRISKTTCARDWINTNEIIATSEIADIIIAQFASHILKTYNTENFILIGLDLAGTVLASRIAFGIDKPFSYVIPSYDIADIHETNLPNISETAKIIFIGDVVSTHSTIKEIVATKKWESRVLATYAILYRKPRNTNFLTTFVSKVYVISDAFSEEIIPSAECPFSCSDEKKCQAQNKKHR